MGSWSRRRVLGAAAVTGLGALSGCGAQGYDAGTLVVENNGSTVHEGTVEARKTADSSLETRTTAAGGWELRREFSVPSGDTVVDPEFVTEAGDYEFRVRLENGIEASGQIGFYEAAGGGIGADAIYVDLYDDRAAIGGSHGD